MTTPYEVKVSKEEGFVQILRDGEEVLYWDELEWLEDDELFYTIANAIILGITNPTAMDKLIKSLNPSPDEPEHPLDHSIDCSCGDRDCPGVFMSK
jgi:hypothetical protein